jgi:hypothetical protein
MFSKKDLAYCFFVHHESHVECSGTEPGPRRWETSDRLSYGTAIQLR